MSMMPRLQGRTTVLRGTVLALFLISGFCGLVYEVVWLRMLMTVFGVTAYAVSTVLAAFMGGLALGSYLFGRYIDRQEWPLWWYALLESVIGLYAFLVPVLLGWINGATRWAFLGFGNDQVLYGVVRASLAAVVLIIPTTCMGATLPVLCKFFIAALDRVGRETGRLYFVNTLGAVVGCAATGFVLIPVLGLTLSTALAASLNLLIAATALIVGRFWEAAPAGRAPAAGTGLAAKDQDRGRRRKSRAQKWILVAFGLSGFSALVFEVVWSRVLVMVFGSTVYSFSAMLSVFLLGLAIGGVLFGWLADRIRDRFQAFAWMQVAIGCLVLIEIVAINHLPGLFLRVLVGAGFTYAAMTAIKFGLSFLVLFPATVLFGGTFPVVTRLYTDDLADTGRSVGAAYAMNTVGAILGSVVGGFVFLPLLGMRGSLVAVALVAPAVGVVTLLLPAARQRSRWAVSTAVAAVVLAGVLLSPAWDKTLLSLGVYFQPQIYVGPDGTIDLDTVVRETKNLYYAEGLNDTIIVNENPGERVLSVNGKIVATSSREDMLIQAMLGYLPMLVHPGPAETALNIGLGTGMTLSGLVAQANERVDCVELEPLVKGAAALFSRENDNVLQNPRLRLIIGDGRNYVALTNERYDVVSSDPFHPYMTGAGNLYALEHFRNARRRLKPGGIMSQWLPLYQLGYDDFRSVVATFLDAFPHVTVWFSGTSVILLGSENRLQLDPAAIEDRLARPQVHAALAPFGLDDPEKVTSFLLADERSLHGYVRGAPINTDARPFVEYSAPRSIFAHSTGKNLAGLLPYVLSPEEVGEYLRSGPTDRQRLQALVRAKREGIEGMVALHEGRPEEAFARLQASLSTAEGPFLQDVLAEAYEQLGLAAQRADALDAAMQNYRAALALRPDRINSLANLGYLYYFHGKYEEARKLLEKAYARHPASDKLMLRLAAVYEALGATERAGDLYRRALDANPRSAKVLVQYGVHMMRTGRLVEAESLLRRSVSLDGAVGTREALVEDLIRQGKLKEAEAESRRLVADAPDSFHGQLFLGEILFYQGKYPDAERNIAAALALDNGKAEPHYQLARILLAMNGPAEAANQLREALTLGGEKYKERAARDRFLQELTSGPPALSSKEGEGR